MMKSLLDKKCRGGGWLDVTIRLKATLESTLCLVQQLTWQGTPQCSHCRQLCGDCWHSYQSLDTGPNTRAKQSARQPSEFASSEPGEETAPWLLRHRTDPRHVRPNTTNQQRDTTTQHTHWPRPGRRSLSCLVLSRSYPAPPTVGWSSCRGGGGSSR